MKILILLGSLRAAAFSRKLSQAAIELAPEGTSFDTTDGRDLPLYDQDIDGDEKPPAVQLLLDQIEAADALLFISPEYNYGIPGPLKNLIDWASRPAFRSPLKDKPSLVVCHSISPAGGSRGHLQLTNVLNGCLAPTYLAPSFLVGQVHEKFDESGALTDDLTKLRLVKTLEGFTEWAGARSEG